MTRLGAVVTTTLLVVLASLSALGDEAETDCSSLYIWPKPMSCSVGDSYTMVLNNFDAVAKHGSSDDLDSILSRYKDLINNIQYRHTVRGPIEPHFYNRTEPDEQVSSFKGKGIPYLTKALVHVSDTNATKSLETDESYTLTINQTGAIIEAHTIWGAVYAMETLYQLVEYDTTTKELFIPRAPITVHDAPRFPWRGLMLDTSNHFLPVDTIKSIVEAMAATKFNVLHWHLVDSYSFPVELPSRPELAQKGAWHPSRTYSTHDVSDIVEHARVRGVRVVPEVDVPGHAYSWGLAYNITVQCPPVLSTDIGPINVVPLDPTKNLTYEVVQDVFSDVGDLFIDKYFHIGGDELQLVCWENDTNIQRYMKEHNVTARGLQKQFQRWALDRMDKQNKKSLVWNEVFEEIPEVLSPKSTVIQVWTDDEDAQKALQAGFDVIVSSGWYLDRQAPVDDQTSWFWLDTWAFMYGVDPINSTFKPPGNMLGGEAAMWSEQVSAIDIEARIWPRAAAVAERLWSTEQTRELGNAATRLARFRCRMASRELSFGPIWADDCDADVPNTKSIPKGHISMPRSDFNVAIIVALIGGALVALFFYALVWFWCHPAGSRSDRKEAKPNAQTASSQETAIGGSDRSPVTGDDDRVPAGELPMNLTSVNTDKASNATDETAPLLATAPVAEQQPQRSPSKERLMSLDVFRGFTIALMIFVDNAGGAFPPIDHTPWNGVRLADFVMPFFDFIVGVSLAISFKKFHLEDKSLRPQRWPAFRKATVRFLKLFIIGMLTQGGIGIMNYDMSKIRIMGILQRVAVCYYVVALFELFLPRDTGAMREMGKSIGSMFHHVLIMFWRYRWHWLGGLILFLTHTGIMYGLDVPPAFGEKCGRGVLTPPCNAATYVDRMVLTVDHMYFPTNGGDPSGNDVTYQRLPECSTCSPGKCVPPPNAPAWCTEGPFDPEGLVSSLNAIIDTVIGIHYGHILLHIKDARARLIHWVPFGFFQIALGLLLHFTCVPMNTDLYSISFTLVTSGTGGVVLGFCYWIVDIVKRGSWVWKPFMFMGMNAIAMYLLAEGGIVGYVLSAFYWGKKSENIGDLLGADDDDDMLPQEPSYSYEVMLWTIGYIVLWMLVAYIFYRTNTFYKI